MAFYRAIIPVSPLINNVYNKFSINSFKLHLTRRQLTTTSKQSSHEGRLPENNKTPLHSLSQYIALRKDEARRSIIVQIASRRSCKDLLSYCSQFGEIANVFYYSLPKDHQFMLLEYKNMASANNALSAATYVDLENVVPSRTNVMWFRKVPKGVILSDLKTQNLPFINSTNYIESRDSIIRNLIMNSPTISAQMTVLYNEYKIQELEIRLKFQMISSLEQYFSGIFPNAIIFPFGSFINGFGRKLSDLDVVFFPDGLNGEKSMSRLVFHAKATNVNEKQQTFEFMGVLADTMKYMIPGIKRVQKVFRARVPIIKFNNIFMHTECDLSMTNVIATYMSELLYLYGEIDNRVRPLVFTIRKWAQDSTLTYTNPGNTISNFSLTLLVIFYLQQQQILPVINQMRGFAEVNENDSHMDKVYLHHVERNWIMMKNNDKLSILLLGFFEYYSTFNFKTNGICLRQGCTIPKTNEAALYIHNPFDKRFNVSKNVSQGQVTRMQSLMIKAIGHLENTKSVKSKTWGILSILNFPVLNNSNIDALDILGLTGKSIENTLVSENDEKTESVQESSISDTTEIGTGEGIFKKV